MKEEIKILMDLGLSELLAIAFCKSIAEKAYEQGYYDGFEADPRFMSWFSNQIDK